jgi:hypothetical protein
MPLDDMLRLLFQLLVQPGRGSVGVGGPNSVGGVGTER